MDDVNAKERVIQVIEKNGIVWPTRFEGVGLRQDTFANEHDVQSLPVTFLISKEGRIVGMNLKGEKLETTIKEQLSL